jgi:hypothetical protein
MSKSICAGEDPSEEEAVVEPASWEPKSLSAASV